MKNYEEVDTPSPEEMQESIASLTPSERALLSDPTFITEDEADLILSDRSMSDGGKSFAMDEVTGKCAATTAQTQAKRLNERRVDFRATARSEYRSLKDQVRREVVDILQELREVGPAPPNPFLRNLNTVKSYDG